MFRSKQCNQLFNPLIVIIFLVDNNPQFSQELLGVAWNVYKQAQRPIVFNVCIDEKNYVKWLITLLRPKYHNISLWSIQVRGRKYPFMVI